MRGLAPTFVRQSDNCDLLHRGMAQQNAFDFNGRNILAAADDHIFQAIANFDVAVRMNHGRVAGVKPTVAHCHGSCLRVVVITAHHYVATHYDLADRLAIVRNLGTLIIHHSCLARGDEFNSLAGFNDCAL